MTTRVEEMLREFEHKIMSVDELGHQAHIGDAYNAIQWLRTALTEAHQAGIDEERERVFAWVNKNIYRIERGDIVKYNLEALQDKK